MAQALLEAKKVSFAYGARTILQEIDLALYPAQLTALLGPNGSGKTTLIQILLGLKSPLTGKVLLEGKSVHDMEAQKRAQKMAYVSQTPFFTFPLSVEEFVALGRYPHEKALFRSYKKSEAVQEAMEITGIAPLASRKFTSLSGGERQKVLIARALAQSPTLLFLDEPTTHLDLRFQIELLQALKKKCKEGLAILAVLHDINLASLFADGVLLLKEGKLLAQGKPEEVLKLEKLQKLYEIKLLTLSSPETSSIFFAPFFEKK